MNAALLSGSPSAISRASPLLAHVASKEGEIAVEYIASKLKGTPAPHEKKLDGMLIPGATYRVKRWDKNGWVPHKEFTVESGKTTDLGDVVMGKE